MSTRNPIRRKLKDYFSSAAELATLTEIGGVALSDGSAIELIMNDDGSLGLLHSSSVKVQRRVDYAGEHFVPPELAPSVLEALILPRGRTDYGTTVDLFTQIFSLFVASGLSNDSAEMCTYFVFASWFPDCLRVAPCLVLAGTEAESLVIFELLRCLVRHALPLSEINGKDFDGLPMHIQPTLLIRCVHPSGWDVLSASNHPHAYRATKNGLVDLFCFKAAYSGSTSGGIVGNAIINIRCDLSGGRSPVINSATLETVSAEFQSKLLDYRLKNVAKLRKADFDAPALPTPLRMMAQAFAACIVDNPLLQAGIIRLLEIQRAVLRESRLLDLDCVTVEALLAHCHGEIEAVRVGVAELAAAVTTILTERGESAEVEPKCISGHLRKLGFCPKRDSQGFALPLSADARRLTHRIARDLQVGDSEAASLVCPDCMSDSSV